MPLDDLIGDMHQDRMSVIDGELRSLEQQIHRRRLESVRMSATLLSQIDDLTQQIINMQPEGGMADVQRKDREPLERERRERQVQLDNEAILSWQDIQALRLQQRQVTKERQEETQDYGWMNGLYDARPR